MLAQAEPAVVATAAPCVSLRGVGVTYPGRGGPVTALTGVDLDVAEGEFVALLGPTGCGKSTLLRIVADLVAPSTGTVAVRGRTPAAARHAAELGFVFQEPALLPWRSALENVALPLEVMGRPVAERRARAEYLLELVGLGRFGRSLPHELSGGMRQRVAIVRALAWDPPVLLMDEPFSALDEITRGALQDELLGLWSGGRKTVLFVTHSLAEAVYLADRVVVMSAHPGRVARVLAVELPRPREQGMRETLPFLDHVRQARAALGGNAS